MESVKAASDIYSPIDGTVLPPTRRWKARPRAGQSATRTAKAGCSVCKQPPEINDMLDAAAYSDLIGA